MLDLRDDLSTALGKCHRDHTEAGSTLEDAALSAREPDPAWYGGLPAVDKGALHH